MKGGAWAKSYCARASARVQNLHFEVRMKHSNCRGMHSLLTIQKAHQGRASWQGAWIDWPIESKHKAVQFTVD